MKNWGKYRKRAVTKQGYDKITEKKDCNPSLSRGDSVISP